MAGNKLIEFIVEALQARTAILWAGEIFDSARKAHGQRHPKCQCGGAQTSDQKRMDHLTVCPREVLEYLQRLSVPQIEIDLRSSLSAHPWTPSVFNAFLAKHHNEDEIDIKAMDLFYLLQGSLSDYMSDTSQTSPFNDHPAADFYRTLAKTQPHMLEWVLEADSGQLERFRDVIVDLEVFKERMDRERKAGSNLIRVKDIVTQDHHSSILHWLIFSGEPGHIEALSKFVTLLKQSKANQDRRRLRHLRGLPSVANAQVAPVNRGGSDEAHGNEGAAESKEDTRLDAPKSDANRSDDAPKYTLAVSAKPVIREQNAEAAKEPPSPPHSPVRSPASTKLQESIQSTFHI